MENYNYKGVEYIPRTKSFKPYRIKGLLFIEKYQEFENKYTEKLSADINNFLLSDKKVQGKVISANNSKDKDGLNEIISNSILSNPSYMIKAVDLQNKKMLARELFISETENAKQLCEIMFENSESINHEPLDETEYNEYYTFVSGVFNDFFTKYSAPTVNVN